MTFEEHLNSYKPDIKRKLNLIKNIYFDLVVIARVSLILYSEKVIYSNFYASYGKIGYIINLIWFSNVLFISSARFCYLYADYKNNHSLLLFMSTFNSNRRQKSILSGMEFDDFIEMRKFIIILYPFCTYSAYFIAFISAIATLYSYIDIIARISDTMEIIYISYWVIHQLYWLKYPRG